MSERSVSGMASVAQVADRPVDAVRRARAGRRRRASGRSRPRRAGCRRRASRMAATARSGSPGTKPGEELAHRRVGQRLEGERREVRRAGAPVRAAARAARAGQGDDEERDALRPVEEVVDEVEEARRRPTAGPRRRGPSVPRAAIRSKKMRQAAKRTSRPPAGAGSSPRSVRRAGSTQRRSSVVRDVLGDRRRDPLAGRRLVVALGEAGAPADHLAERPERDAVAVGGRAAAVPVDRLDHAVDVLLELPGEAALADAGRAR